MYSLGGDRSENKWWHAMWQVKMFQEPRRGIQQPVESKRTTLVRFWMLNEQRGKGIWDWEHGKFLGRMAMELLWLKEVAARGRSRQWEWKGRLGPVSKMSKESVLCCVSGEAVRHWCLLEVQLCKQNWVRGRKYQRQECRLGDCGCNMVKKQWNLEAGEWLCK